MKRNYSKGAPPKAHAQLFKCPECNRKYKSEVKVKEHVESKHYYATQTTPNWKQFTNQEKQKIIMLAMEYKNILFSSEEEMQKVFPRLLPQGGQVTDAFIETQRNFRKTMLETYQCYDWGHVITDFECFLNMGIPYYDTNFCPSIAIDFLWHSCMLDGDFYARLCKESCGRVIPHCAEERIKEEDQARHTYFCQVFEHRWNKKLASITPHPVDLPSVLEQLVQEERKRMDSIEAEKRKWIAIQEERHKRQKQEADELEAFHQQTGVKVERYDYLKNIYEPLFYTQGYSGAQLEGNANVIIHRREYEEACNRKSMASSC